jgi:hypothetical protein
MSRPNRLYTIDGKYYYIKDGKKVFVKVPAGVSQKQVSKINIKNIIKLAETKRVVRKKKRRNLSYQKKIAPTMEKTEQSGLPIYFFKPQRNIPTLQDQANASADTTVEKLAKLLLKESTLVPSSSKLSAEPTIAQGKSTETEKKGSNVRADGLATEIYKLSEDGEPYSLDAVRNLSKYRGKNISEEVYNKALQIAEKRKVDEGKRQSEKEAKESRPGLLQRMFSPAKVSPSPLEKAAAVLKGTPSKAKTETSRNLGASLETVSEEETPIGIERTTGKGYDSSDGLYDDEIETIAKKRLKDFVPVIAKDETNELMKYVKKGDKQFSFVINTDDSMDRGRHWRCVYINNRDDFPSIEYFDPLTEGKPEQSLIDACRKIAIKMNPEKLFKYKQNMIRRQSKLSSNCGYHCIHFLEGRYMGIPFSEITGYDDFVEKMKNQHGELDGSGLGEKEIKPFMKKYDSYI